MNYFYEKIHYSKSDFYGFESNNQLVNNFSTFYF
jgi:hypothetical protein